MQSHFQRHRLASLNRPLIMSQIIYTIAIADGQFQGASHHTDGQDAAPLDLTALAAIVPSINAAAVEKLGVIEAQLSALATLQATMTAHVTAVLQSRDPAQYEALAIEFLTPEQDRIRAEKLAQLEALKTELGL